MNNTNFILPNFPVFCGKDGFNTHPFSCSTIILHYK